MKAYDIWVPFAFAVTVGIICLVTRVLSADAWVPTYLAFSPLAFLFSGAAHARTRRRIAELETRLREVRA
jgi:hypothetical protein